MVQSGESLTDTVGDPALLEQNLLQRVLAEVRWSFTVPCSWLLGVALNLALSLLWLIWVPLRGGSHADSVILVGTYFAEFIMADVTTTNVFGPDAARVRVSLALGVPVRRILLTKNYALLMIAGLPTLLLTAILTLRSELPYRLVDTLPGVALPMMAWLGVGNVVSVLLPVATFSLRQRWRERRELARTARWLGHLALPYVLLYAVDPVSDVPHAVFGNVPPHWHNVELRGLIALTTGLAIWAAGTVLAGWIAAHREIRLS